MYSSEQVCNAVRDSWGPETCGEPDGFSASNPAWNQCDASAFVVFEHLGGDLVLGEVLVDGERTEHHYWNRIDGVDIDLTRRQFVRGEQVEELDVLSREFVQENMRAMKPEVLERIEIMREKVAERLAVMDRN